MIPTYPAISTCLWLAIDVQFTRSSISAANTSGLWRAVLKDGLLQADPGQFTELFEPMRFRKLDSHIDCPGIVIETEIHGGFTRIHLKFLGSAARFSAACLLAFESKLRSGVGRQAVTGFIAAINIWNGQKWKEISMPVVATDLDSWRSNPAFLTGFDLSAVPSMRKGTLRISTRTHWMVRSQGKVVRSAPDLVQILKMVEQRSMRVESAWGNADKNTIATSILAATKASILLCSLEQSWQFVRTAVAGKYPSDGSRGHLIFDGEVSSEILYWLHAGSFWHIGQQTALGLGGYAVDFKPMTGNDSA